jgi:hypothetical protein
MIFHFYDDALRPHLPYIISYKYAVSSNHYDDDDKDDDHDNDDGC